MASPQQVPKRLAPEQDARRRFIDDLRSDDPKSRMSAMSSLLGYLERTINPPQFDPRFFPLLRYAHREDAIEGRPPSQLDLRFFPVLRFQQRMDALRSFVPQLMERLADTDAQVRSSAAYLLGQAGAREALPLLRRISQNDPEPQVRTAAAASLEALEAGAPRGR